jgi:hypothetical protein
MAKLTPVFSEEDSDLHRLNWRSDRCGYARTWVNGNVCMFAHHMVCIRAFGRRPDWSKREVTDHIDRNKLNNRRDNLRITTVRDNTIHANAVMRRKNHDFSMGGITKHKKSGKWQVTLFQKYIGLCDDIESARRLLADSIAAKQEEKP